MECLRELHLPTIRELYEDLVRRAVQESWGYEQFLCELVERECQVRQINRTERDHSHWSYQLHTTEIAKKTVS